MGRLADWTVEQYNADRTHVRSSELKDIAGKRGPREYYFKHVEPTLPDELLSAMYPAWVSARKREVAEVLKEKLTSREQAAELMEVE